MVIQKKISKRSMIFSFSFEYSQKSSMKSFSSSNSGLITSQAVLVLVNSIVF